MTVSGDLDTVSGDCVIDELEGDCVRNASIVDWHGSLPDCPRGPTCSNTSE